ncbi:hypothetical protein THOE12_20644 [Vibrio rotiferianus]|nr:hypothetical protein THOE12_20644 [Vibrio rotiferianus]
MRFKRLAGLNKKSAVKQTQALIICKGNPLEACHYSDYGFK